MTIVLEQGMLNASDGSWSWIWKLAALENVRFFFWLACHNLVRTNSLLACRGILLSNVCQRCGLGEETFLHCVRDCQDSLALWHALGFVSPTFIRIMDVQVFICTGASESRGKWFMAGLWWAWRARNMQCLSHDKVTLPRLLALVNSLAGTMEKCFPTPTSLSRQERWIKWHKDDDHSIIVNMDDSCIGNLGRVDFGGLIRNFDGSWITGFSGFIGISNNIHAELLALLHGVKLAWHKGFCDIICYSDSMNVISLLRDPLPPFHKYVVLVQEIRAFMSRDWSVATRHTLMEGNQCTNFLAKLGASNEDGLVIHEDPPQGLSCPLLADKVGVAFLLG